MWSQGDLIGLALVLALLGWTYMSYLSRGGEILPTAGLILLCAGVFVGARLLAAVEPTIVPLAIVTFAFILGIAHREELYSAVALSEPLGYANAKGALYLQAALAALVIVVSGRGWFVRGLGVLFAVGFGAVPIAGESWAAVALLALTLVAIGSAWLFSERAAVLLLAAAFVTALGMTVIAASAEAGGSNLEPLKERINSTLSARRIQMWGDAFEVMRDYPLQGVGPGRFEEFGAEALRDPLDSRWAHNEFLQFGADTGIAGFALLMGLFGWGFNRLSLTPRRILPVIGAAAIAALGIHACIDYVLHFPEVPTAASALVGAASMSARS